MKKTTVLMAALVAVTLVGSIAQAQPATQAQQCYNLKPFTDIISLNYTTIGPNQVLFGNWTASGVYSLPVVGAREANVNGGPKRVSLNGTNDTTDFDGDLICAIDATINGPFTIVCDGTGSAFTTTGSNFAPVSCSDANPVGEPAGKSGKSAKAVSTKDTLAAAAKETVHSGR